MSLCQKCHINGTVWAGVFMLQQCLPGDSTLQLDQTLV